MEYSALVDYASNLLLVMAGLVFSVNIIVEVVKGLFPKIPTTFVATILSVAITMAAFFAWAAYTELTITWYYVAAALILGLFVAYAAMFGFDKLKQALSRLKGHYK